MRSKIIWLDFVGMADLVSDRKSRLRFHQSDNKKISHKRPGVGKENLRTRRITGSQGGETVADRKKTKAKAKADAEFAPTGRRFVVNMRMHTKHKKKTHVIPR